MKYSIIVLAAVFGVIYAEIKTEKIVKVFGRIESDEGQPYKLLGKEKIELLDTIGAARIHRFITFPSVSFKRTT